MAEPRLHFVACSDPYGGHRMAYWQWGETSSAHVVMCVHGLTRQGRDFDELAKALLVRADGHFRVICPDMVGRGRSAWLHNSLSYHMFTYAADVLTLIAKLHLQHPIDTFDFLGTSMGGLIGMSLAGGANHLPWPVPIRRLVLNDVGPSLNPEGLIRIGQYVGDMKCYRSLAEATEDMRRMYAGFGPHTPAQWQELTCHMIVPASHRNTDCSAKVKSRKTAGPFVPHYDPAIVATLPEVTPEVVAVAEAASWAFYDRIYAKTLLVRGAQSDVLTHDVAIEMTQRGPQAELVEFEGVGHAPTFVAPEQSRVVADFLLN